MLEISDWAPLIAPSATASGWALIGFTALVAANLSALPKFMAWRASWDCEFDAIAADGSTGIWYVAAAPPIRLRFLFHNVPSSVCVHLDLVTAKVPDVAAIPEDDREDVVAPVSPALHVEKIPIPERGDNVDGRFELMD